jgi:hypothetical protein
MLDSRPPSKDKVIADTGWGVKPDDQPANAAEAEGVRTFRYDPSLPDVIRTILRTQRRNFNAADRVRVAPGKTTILDLNGDPFVVEGLSYGDENMVELLTHLGAAVSPDSLRAIDRNDTNIREYRLTRAWAWGAERSGG